MGSSTSCLLQMVILKLILLLWNNGGRSSTSDQIRWYFFLSLLLVTALHDHIQKYSQLDYKRRVSSIPCKIYKELDLGKNAFRIMSLRKPEPSQNSVSNMGKKFPRKPEVLSGFTLKLREYVQVIGFLNLISGSHFTVQTFEKRPREMMLRREFANAVGYLNQILLEEDPSEVHPLGLFISLQRREYQMFYLWIA